MSLPATYNFTGSGALSASWTQQTGDPNDWSRVSDQGEPTVYGGDAGEYWNADTPNNDQYVQVVLKVINGGSAGGQQGGGIGIRCSTSARTYFRIVVNSAATGNTEIAKSIAGSYTQLSNTTQTWSVNDVMRAEVSGSSPNIQLVLKNNGGTLVTLSSIDNSGTSLDSGMGGLQYSSTMTQFALDDFEVGNLSAGGGAVQPPLMGGDLSGIGSPGRFFKDQLQ